MWPHGPAPGWWRMMILTPAPARQPLSYSVTIQSLISLAPYGMSMHDVPKNWPREALLLLVTAQNVVVRCPCMHGSQKTGSIGLSPLGCGG